ncbi:MAG: hypothetical protein VKL59_09660 [Nostocaceae cyanobacterium]|nr:hypothetical protein [Nostocaceae cyanobacterium]
MKATKKVMPLLLSAVLLSSATACGKTQDNISSTPNSANGKNTVAQNTNSTVSTSPNQPILVAAGTGFDTILQSDVSTGKNKNNDRFTLKVKNSSVGKNETLKDATIQGHLEDVTKAAKGKKASLHLVFDDIVLKNGDVYPIDATLVNTQVETKTKGKFVQNAAIIVGGAVAGKFVGDKTKFKHGALAGGTAAAAYVLSSPGGEVVLKKGNKIQLKLKTPLK